MPRRSPGKTTKIPKDVETYLRSIEKDKPRASADLHKLAKLVRNAFDGSIYVNMEQYNAYLKIGEAMFPKVLPWQKFLCVLMLCTYKFIDNRPRWNHLLAVMARGGGKDGCIAWFALCLTSKNNPVKKYDVDICANNEDQSMRPVKDAIEFLEDPDYMEANKASFYWTSELIKGLSNGGRIKGHTNNAKGKDGLRSGCVILNEIHQYEEYANIDVFLTGLGKVACPRSMYFSTNGHVREGVLDDEMAQAEDILNGTKPDNGFLPFICRIDSKEEVHDEANWYKANPSLPYFPDLLDETRKDYAKWLDSPATLPGFMAKRMNYPTLGMAHAVAEYDRIKATNRPLPDLEGCRCIVGIDTAKTSDFESVSAIFKKDGYIYCINHTWVCSQSKDWGRIKFKSEFPRLVEMGLVTIVNDVEIPASCVTNYIQALKEHYTIQCVCIDDFRYALFASELSKIGFKKDFKNLKMVRPSDIAKIVPVVESYFNQDHLIWGDNPMLRWATNNVKVISWRTKTTGDSEMGNQLYAKIEPKSRKTDPFMSFAHAMTEEPNLLEAKPRNTTIFRTRTY